MFDDDDRRLVQVASIANAIGAAENAAPWRGLLWLAGEVEAGTLAARLFIPVRMRTVDTTRASSAEALGAWRSMAKRVRAALVDPNLKLDKRDSYLPSAASTWHVHVNDLLQFIDAAEMHSGVRAELRELAQRYRGARDTDPAPAVAALAERAGVVEPGSGNAAAAPETPKQRRARLPALVSVAGRPEPADGEPKSAPTSTATAALDWQTQARDEARRIRTERAKRGLFPPLEVLGDEVARTFRECGINGTNGHPLTGAYIKRHALQGHGITNDTDRLKAALNARGK